MWRFERKPWTFTSGSEKAEFFARVTAAERGTRSKRLPKLIGRIGLAVAREQPNVVYAILEAKKERYIALRTKAKLFSRSTKIKTSSGADFYIRP
jgi:hypothetical protein